MPILVESPALTVTTVKHALNHSGTKRKLGQVPFEHLICCETSQANCKHTLGFELVAQVPVVCLSGNNCHHWWGRGSPLNGF